MAAAPDDADKKWPEGGNAGGYDGYGGFGGSPDGAGDICVGYVGSMKLGDYDQSNYTNRADTAGTYSVGDSGRLVCVYSRHAHDENEGQ